MVGKKELAVKMAHSLSTLVGQVNQENKGDSPILKEDIVQILREGDTFFLLYYK